MIQVENLTRVFGPVVAVNNLSLEIERGSIFGFVGPNGAGKTTAMRVLATLLPPTSGQCRVDGHDVVKNPEEVRGLTGYMPDFFGIYDELKVWEYLDFYGACFGLSPARRKELIPGLLDLVDLVDWREAYVDTLSRGMKQRLCLARALAHDPEFLILDEPASGLDPRARLEIKRILRELKSRGKTTLISSHILPELAEICSHIGIIHRGEMVVAGPVDKVLGQMKADRFLVIKVLGEGERARETLRSLPCLSQVTLSPGGTIEAGFSGKEEDLPPLLGRLVQENIPVVSFTHRESNLEDVFLQVTGEGKNP